MEDKTKIVNVWVGAIFLETQLEKIDAIFN